MPKTRPADPAAEPVLVAGRRRLLPDAAVRRAVALVLRGERRQVRLSVTFLGRDAMRRLNARYLGHDRPTDVVAFALPGPAGALAGDVYLCPWVAARSARTHGVPLQQELLRLVIHGTLHVVGWEHPEGGERTESPMWRRQEKYLGRLR
jgi:probable rRNA maturation factor